MRRTGKQREPKDSHSVNTTAVSLGSSHAIESGRLTIHFRPESDEDDGVKNNFVVVVAHNRVKTMVSIVVRT